MPLSIHKINAVSDQGLILTIDHPYRIEKIAHANWRNNRTQPSCRSVNIWQMKRKILKSNLTESLVLPMILLFWLLDTNGKTQRTSTAIPIFTSPLLLFFLLGITVHTADVNSQDEPEFELVNFAFSNYLGSGFYTSSSGEVFVIKVPFSTNLSSAKDDEPQWVINYPVTVGTANINEIAAGTLPDLNDVSTISIIPSLEFHYPLSSDWWLIPFVDLGIAKNLDSGRNRWVKGAGVKSFVTFDFGKNWLILGNRLLYAEQESFDRESKSNFAVFETGLDYNIPINRVVHRSTINLSLYYINSYYLRDLVFLDILDARVSLENKNEFGFTVSLPKYSWLPDKSRIGLGVQITKTDDLYRLYFGAPFF